MNGQFLSLILVPKCISSRLTFSVLVKQWVLFSVQLLLWHILIIFLLCAVYWKESGSKPMCKHRFPADAAGTNFLNYNLRVRSERLCLFFFALLWWRAFRPTLDPPPDLGLEDQGAMPLGQVVGTDRGTDDSLGRCESGRGTCQRWPASWTNFLVKPNATDWTSLDFHQPRNKDKELKNCRCDGNCSTLVPTHLSMLRREWGYSHHPGWLTEWLNGRPSVSEWPFCAYAC